MGHLICSKVIFWATLEDTILNPSNPRVSVCDVIRTAVSWLWSVMVSFLDCELLKPLSLVIKNCDMSVMDSCGIGTKTRPTSISHLFRWAVFFYYFFVNGVTLHIDVNGSLLLWLSTSSLRHWVVKLHLGPSAMVVKRERKKDILTPSTFLIVWFPHLIYKTGLLTSLNF